VKGWLFIIFALGVCLSLIAASGLRPSATRPVATFVPTPTTLPDDIVQQMIAQPNLALGAAVYAENCTACHGLEGRGDGPSVLSGGIKTPPPDFRQPTLMSVQTTQDIFAVISLGRLEKYMPPWERILPEAERWAVAAYVLELMRPAAP
jgi:mono/diheme cytochrome c family protein